VVNFGNDGVTVVHGSLRQFAGGVDFGEVRHNRLLDISASKTRPSTSSSSAPPEA
jgi:hypothetical protein